MQVTVNDEVCDISFHKYSNDRLAIRLTTEHGEPYATASVNLPDVSDSHIKNVADSLNLDPSRMVFMRIDNCNKIVVDALRDQGYLKGPYDFQPSGWIRVPLYYWRKEIGQ